MQKVRRVRYITRKKSKIKKSTAHTLEKHGLEHNYISIALKNTTKYRMLFLVDLKISLSEPKILKAPHFQNTACFFTYQHVTYLFQEKRKVQTSPMCVLKEEERGNEQNKNSYTKLPQATFHDCDLQKKKFLSNLDRTLLGGEMKKVNAR